MFMADVAAYVMKYWFDLSLMRCFILLMCKDFIQAMNKTPWNGLLIFYSFLSLAVYSDVTYCPWLGQT